MTFVSYAQNLEDVVLWRALNDVKAGSYLDIGAQDPELDSVSLAFYRAGWRGIHVEPTPAYATRLRQERPDEVVIQAAVSEAPGPIELHEFFGTGLSTGKSVIAASHRDRGFKSTTIFVPSVRLDEILKMARVVHWMKIDVEGMEQEVLRSWGSSRARPWVVVIEATLPMEQSRTDHLWRSEVEQRGYREVYNDGLSRYFLHESQIALTDRFSTPPNIFDGYQVSSRHFSTQQFAQDADNEIREAGRRAEQLQSELSIAHDQVEVASAEADGVKAQLAAANLRVAALQEERDVLSNEAERARKEQIDAIQRLTSAAAEHSTALNAAWRERHEFEIQLREQWRRKDEENRAAEASRVAGLSRDLAELHTWYRTEIRTREESERAERNHLFKELAERKAELAAATATIDRGAQEFDRLKNAKDAVDEQIVQLSTTIAALHASHASEIAEIGRRAERERDRLVADMASLDDQLTLEINRLRDDTARERAELDRTVAESADRATAIEALINTAMAQPVGAWLRFGRALGIAQDDGARQILSTWKPDRTAATRQNSEPETLMTIDVESRNACLQANSLKELLAWHDVDFVRCAYATVLGRQPDPEGEAYYVDRIRRGFSKMEMLRQLRNSTEGSNNVARTIQLDHDLRRSALFRTPGFRWLAPEPFSNSRSERLFRSIANATALLASNNHALVRACGELSHCALTMAEQRNELAKTAPSTPEPDEMSIARGQLHLGEKRQANRPITIEELMEIAEGV